MPRRNLKVVRLLEPELCLECRFAHRASVELEDGSFQTMIYCRRLDCDNWDFTSSDEIRNIEILSSEDEP